MKEKEPNDPTGKAIYWYSQARDKANEFIRAINEHLRVKIVKHGGEFELMFYHKEDPEIAWAMRGLGDIDQKYLDEDFQKVVLKHYKSMVSLKWYKQAEERVLEFLHKLDPDLSVRVDLKQNRDPETKELLNSRVLVFEHEKHPQLRWWMKIEELDEYIHSQLEQDVTEAYQQLKHKYGL